MSSFHFLQQVQLEAKIPRLMSSLPSLHNPPNVLGRKRGEGRPQFSTVAFASPFLAAKVGEKTPPPPPPPPPPRELMQNLCMRRRRRNVRRRSTYKTAFPIPSSLAGTTPTAVVEGETEQNEALFSISAAAAAEAKEREGGEGRFFTWLRSKYSVTILAPGGGRKKM